jgi:hypothetical protein
MNYIAKWCDDIQSRTPTSVPARLTATGVRDQHVGPRMDYAKIEVVVEPAESFDVRFGPDVEASETNRLFLEAAIFGLLDILLVSGPYPLRNVSITIARCEIDPIDSSQMAFRHAGRDAGRKIISALGAGTNP